MGAGDIQFDDAALRQLSDRMSAWPAAALEAGRTVLENSMRQTLQALLQERAGAQDAGVRGKSQRSGSAGAAIEGTTLSGYVTFRDPDDSALEDSDVLVTAPGGETPSRSLVAAMTDASATQTSDQNFSDMVIKRVRKPFVDPQSGALVPAGATVAFRQARKAPGRESARDVLGRPSGDSLDRQIKAGELIPMFWLTRRDRIQSRPKARAAILPDTARINASVVTAMQNTFKVTA